MDSVARHEASLTAHALRRLQAVTGLTVYGAGDPTAMDERVGVIAFNVGSVPHALVAAILGYEAGNRRAERLFLRAILRCTPAGTRARATGPLAA